MCTAAECTLARDTAELGTAGTGIHRAVGQPRHSLVILARLCGSQARACLAVDRLRGRHYPRPVSPTSGPAADWMTCQVWLVLPGRDRRSRPEREPWRGLAEHGGGGRDGPDGVQFRSDGRDELGHVG